MTRPLILVSNDDGIFAPGIETLAGFASKFGDVVVAAPIEERSGTSHAITLESHLRVRELGGERYAVSGTPVDCVYMGVLHLCSRTPDLVLSGINDGYNLGSDVFYSGTVGAAREGCFRGAPALAISVNRESDPKHAFEVLDQLIPEVLSHPQGGSFPLLNVNVPADPKPGKIEVTRLGERRYHDRVEQRRDLRGKHYYWIGGPPVTMDCDEGTDLHAIQEGHVSVTPLSLEMTGPDLDYWRSKLA